MRPIPLILILAATAVAEESSPVSASQAALRLEDAVRLSATTAPVDIARLDAAVSSVGLSAERMALLPNVSLSSGLTRAAAYQAGSVLPAGNTWDTRLRLGQAIMDLEAIHRVKAAGRRLAATEAATTLALEDAADLAARSWVALATAQALVETRRENLRLAKELSAQAQARVDAGAAEGITATRAATQVAAAEAALVVAEGSVARAAIALARATGLDAAQQLTTTQALDEAPAAADLPQPDEAIRGALATRPELRVEAATLAALESEREAASAARLPHVNSFADGGRIGPDTNALGTSWAIGVAVTIPLIDRRIYDDEAAELRVRRGVLRQRDLESRVRAEVRDALAAFSSAEARIAATTVGLELGSRQVREARARFAAGAGGNIEVTEAQGVLTAAEEQRLAARQALAEARVRLARVTGTAVELR